MTPNKLHLRLTLDITYILGGEDPQDAEESDL